MVKPEYVTNKIAVVRDHVDRVRANSEGTVNAFLQDRDRQDIVCFNLFHAVQGCMDLASHLIGDEGWGTPGSYREMSDILVEKAVISSELGEKLKEMIGFRNRLAHEYGKIDFEEIYDIMTTHLSDIDEFVEAVVNFTKL